jgi:hypothetical protein
LTAASRQHVSEREDRQGRILRARMDLAQVVAETATQLNELLTFYVHSHESGYRASELLERAPFTPCDAQNVGWLLLPPGQQRQCVEVVVAAAFRLLREDDPADIAALLRVDEVLGNGNVHEPHVIWAQTYYGTPIASARQASVLADIRTSITNRFPEAIREVIRILSEAYAKPSLKKYKPIAARNEDRKVLRGLL